MKKEKTLLIIFAKNPLHEKVKTRLAISIGEQKARKVYQKLIDFLVEEHKEKNYDLLFFIKGREDYFLERGLQTQQVQVQQGEDLGEKINNAFNHSLQEYAKAVLIGSDLPLKEESINKALKKLEQVDVVIGPAKDGGYYLVALKKPQNIFSLKSWSHEQVLSQTIKLIKKENLNFSLLDEKTDIDTVENLQEYPEFLPKS